MIKKKNISSSEESENEEEIFSHFDAEASLIVQKETLPKKSSDRYLLVYDTYKNWRQENKNALSKEEENNLIVYFKQISQRLKPTTLWSVWSMLRKTLNTHENLDIGQFLRLKSLLKNNAKGYKPKKSLVFKWKEVENFMNDVDDHLYLGAKVVLVFGICGALRCNELTYLKTDDIEDTGTKFIVSVKDTKTDFDRQFIIGPLFYNTVQKYIMLRPAEKFTDRFFLQYCKGKCNRQVMGKNKIGEIPEIIASYLRLENPKLYTGHCFRRSAATFLSESGANMQMIKQLGGWRSDTVAQGYVENSLRNRDNIFKGITHAATSSTETPNKENEPPSMMLDWDDFPDDFGIIDEKIQNQLKAIENSPSFTTAAISQGKSREKIAALQSLQLTQNHTEAGHSKAIENSPSFTTAAILQGKSREKIAALQSLQLTQNHTEAGHSNIRQHFLTKEPIKVFFNNRDSSESPSKKKRNAGGESGPDVNPIPSLNKENEIENNVNSMLKNSRVRFENCTFNNCTFTIVSCACEDKKS